MRLFRVLVAASVAAFLMLPSRIAAQDLQPDTAGVRLPPVTVTATRHATSIFAAPLAVTVIGKKELETKRGYSLADAVSAVPGVFAQSRYGTSDIRLTIRGFGARGAGDRSNAGTSRGIRVLIDGIPETEPDGRTSFDLVDLAAANRVEVVRSNASALWGNAGGGVIDISTVPEFHRDFASVQQMAGTDGFLRTAVQGGSRFGPASLAATFTNTMQDGYRAHSDSRRSLVNASLTSPLGQSTDLGIYVTAANDLFHIPGPLTMAEAMSDPRKANATYAARDERRWNRVGRVGLSLGHSLTDASMVSGMLFVNPKVLQRSERGTFRDFNRYHLGGNLVYRAEYDLGESLAANTIVGADRAYQNGTILFYSLTSAGTRGTELRDNKSEGAANTGVFVQQELRAGEHLGVDLGARWDQIRYDYRSFINPKLNDAKDFSRVSPKIGVNYRVNPTHSFYANIGGGVEAPAGNETDPASTFGQDTVTALNPLLEPIRSTTYEIGTKHLLPFSGGMLSAFSYDVALYHTNVTNEIIPYRGGRFYFTAGKVHRRGAEIGAALLGRSDLEISGSLTLSDNEYIDYTVDSVHYGKPGKSASYAGNDVAGVPPMFYAVSAGRSVSETIPIRLQVNVRGVGDYFVDDANTVEVPAYHIFGATLSTANGIALGRMLVKAFVSVENLADRRYIGSAFVNPDVVNGVPVAFEPGSGRTYLFSLSLGPR
ncbi:MAG TPA: TonB-dependent receptor [Gemmatimonadaceae bacterium]|nr:TonB-dependent receptor [Gemmatimonadaceae bacterium]